MKNDRFTNRVTKFFTTGRYINQQGAQTESLAKNKGNATTNIGGDTFNINIQAMGKLKNN